MKYPVGSRFITKDLGLVRSYLPNMVEKKESRFITTMDIYKDEPWLLHHVRNPLFYANEWYYFVPRTRKGANGVTPNRIVAGRGGRPGGFWKSTGKRLNIIDGEHRLMGHKQCLTYHTGVHGNSVMTDWRMTEYTLAKKKDEFQELVLCFIRLKKKTKDKNLGFVDVFVPQPQPQPPLQVVENNMDTNNLSSSYQVVQEEAGLIGFADELEMMLEGDIPQQRQEEETPKIPPTQRNNNNNVLMVSSQQEVQEEEADLTGYADNLEMMMLQGDQEPEQQQQQQEEEIRIAPPMHINDDNNIDWDWDIHDADTWAMLDFFLG